MSRIEKNLIKQARRFNQPIPERIKNKPKLGIGLDIFLDAFYDLEHDRIWLTGEKIIPLPISWSAIAQYTNFYEITGILRDELLYFVKELDNAYIKHISK